MTKLSKLAFALGLVVGAISLAVVLSRRTDKGPESDLLVSATEPAPAPRAADDKPSPVFSKRAHGHSPASPTAGQPMAGATAGPGTAANWEDKLDEVLGSNSPDSDKARQMLDMFPQLAPEGQEEAARHLANLVSDENYGQMTAHLTNAALPKDVLDVLLEDALNRPNRLKLPALLEVARTPQHPNAAEAKDFLELILDQDHGDDWPKWQAGMEQWLQSNPD